ncbi:band 4.1-like protein 4 isoform X2 [Planococcus citri]|uniref:band 4.1-like protein 4 isoform X2 n=1 Tax=Planococcus citri TaxID=170843 RepID=UPI0031F99E89
MRCFCTKTRTYHCKVVLLDDQELLQEIQSTSTGQDVLDTVFRHLNLIETSYFGLRYVDCNNQTHWLDTTKKITKQLKGKDSFTLYFGVKFYAADPCKLVEEITRYQFFLQVKQDILQGRLPAPFDLIAELGAYAVQSELGDYDPRRHSPGYVSEFRFISNQTVELENKIAELHKDLQGQLPAVAELNYLDKVKWLEMYGVDLHPVIGEDNVEYFLGLTPIGVIVLRNKVKVANYYWSRIKKIYFKGKYFMLRVSDKNNEENTYGFETPSRAACKHLYKCCKEHHSFFQLVHVSTNAPDVVNTRFSSRMDKLSGRSSQMGMRNPPSFIRTPSRRYQRRIVEGAAETPKIEDKVSVKENVNVEEPKSVYVASSTTNSFYIQRSDSPRSTRSAPWSVWGTTGPPRNSYSSHSPRSVRSAGPQVRLTHARRSSSMESQSSTDSRPCRRHKHKNNKRGSDNESDLSRCSSQHGHSHRRHRHRSRRSSGSEQEHHSSHHGNHTRYKLIDSEGQWKEVQRRQAEGNSGIHEATVVRPRSGYINSGIETESEHSSCHHHRRKHRKHRSRSRSPETGKSHLPEELKQHLEFQLVDTEGMSEDQLREIPYTVVKTNAAKAVRVRLSSSGKPKVQSIRRAKNDVIKETLSGCNEDSPPPPYSESPILSDLGSKTTSTNTTACTAAGDSNKQISSHLTRVSSHMMRNNNINQKPSCSALYGNPSTLLGHPHYLPASNHSKDIPNGNSSWISNGSNFPDAMVIGLPPQPHSRRPYSNSHSDLSLNTSRSNQKGWPSGEIRGTVGLPWSPLAEQIQSPSVNSLYSTLDSSRRAPIFSSDYNNTNQNILEHRSINGNVFRNSPKASPQVPQVSTSTPVSQQSVSVKYLENEKMKKHHTPAETGVLRSYTNTPNGKVAWPNERQLGWQPKVINEKGQSASNSVGHNWSNNSSWNGEEYLQQQQQQQWNNGATNNAVVTNMIPTQSWQPQMQPQPPVNFRNSDRGPLLFAPPPQMHRINENVTAEAAAENKSNFINFINNNQQAISPNNNHSNTQHSIISEINSRTNIQTSGGKKHENSNSNGESFLNSSNHNINDSNNNDQNQNNHDLVKQFIQEMSTEL